MCLGVFSTNYRAIALYKRMGFIEEGRKVNEVKLNEKEDMDDILMFKLMCAYVMMKKQLYLLIHFNFSIVAHWIRSEDTQIET